ncbi:MAG: FHA domain-containing protein [Nitrospiraceae bacterium]|nr:MAG: FHA domain-containing protein [Nitrospiraceae bacterium]
MPNGRSKQPSSIPPVYVRVQQGTTWSDERRFIDTFRIGRDPECELPITERVVSKVHAEVRCEEGQWWLVDLQSRNGTYLDGERIERALLPSSCKVELGQGGPILWMSVGRQVQVPERPSDKTVVQEAPESVTELVQRLEKTQGSGEGGDQTRLYGQALQRITKRRSRWYQVVLVIVGVLLVGAVAVAFYQYQKIEALRATAGEIFYAMKRVELQVAQLEEQVEDKRRAEEMQDILTKRQEIKNLESKYDRFVKELGLYDVNMSEQDRAVFRVARLFGECEATMPKEFIAEVNKYILRWKSTDRLTNGIRRAHQQGYTGAIAGTMFNRNLPPHFFYLALQESGFDVKAIGPNTRMGYAKGMWQFVPPTAKDFGLKTGPLQHLAEYDPDDERFNFSKATDAAARYIKRIYLTDAQASGLLVIASYNWGEGNVTRMIKQMPQNPQDRNFWQLLKQFKIPQETYDYVFFIVAAAVIGENPQLFGFDFPAPFPRSRP